MAWEPQLQAADEHEVEGNRPTTRRRHNELRQGGRRGYDRWTGNNVLVTSDAVRLPISSLEMRAVRTSREGSCRHHAVAPDGCDARHVAVAARWPTTTGDSDKQCKRQHGAAND